MKKISIIALILLVAVAAFAERSREAIYHVIPSAEKGLNSHISPWLTPENMATEATNVRVNDEYGSVSKRDVMVTEVTANTAAVKGLHRYYQSDGDAFTIAGSGTLLIYDSGVVSTTPVTIQNGLSDGKRWQFITYKDMMIATNGTNLPLKWDGLTTTTENTDNARTAGDLCAELGAPFAQLSSENGGNDLDAEKWYQYKIAFYDGTTYSYSQSRSNPIKTGTAVSATQNLTLTDIPIGPTGTTYRYIYRTEGAANEAAVRADTSFYFVDVVTGNTVTTYNDAYPDATINTNRAPTWLTVTGGVNATPPICKFFDICSERLFEGNVITVTGNTAANDTNYYSSVYWSDDGNPNYFYPTWFIDVRPDDGDQITFLKTFLGILTVGKTNSISKFYTEGSATTDWSLSNPFSFIGCHAPYSAQVTPLGIIYLNRHGLYRFTGQSSELISDAVTTNIEDISPANVAECVGYFWGNEYHLSYTSESSSSATNNRILIYDTVRDAYVLDTKNVDSFVAFNAGTDAGTLYTGSSSTDGVVAANSPTIDLMLKKYKSELDAGTFSSTSSGGTEYSPTLSIITLDNMDTYTSNDLARAGFVVSDNTATRKVPPDLGTGVDDIVTFSSDDSLTSGEYNYTSMTIDAGTTISAGKGTIIKCLGDITVNGYLYCGGDLTIYAHTITVGAAGRIVGDLTLRANTITNNGTITGDMGLIGTWAFYAGGAGTGAGLASMYDDNWTTNAVEIQYADTGVSCTFPFIADIETVKYSTAGVHNPGAPGTVAHTISLDGSTIASHSNTFTNTQVSVPGKDSTSGMNCYISCSSAGDYGYLREVQMYLGTPTIDYINGSLGTIRPTPATSDTTDFINICDTFSEDDIVNQGDYSLKWVIPGTLIVTGNTITKTISATDLSSPTYIAVDLYALQTGTNLKFGLGEGSLTNFIDLPVTTSNTWETVLIDISGIADADINATTRIGFKCFNTVTGNVVYFDNIKVVATTGTWTSPVYTVNAASFKKLYWNENLNTYGDVKWGIRTGNTTPPDATWTTWTASSYTTPTGSDISAETGATYCQLMVTFNTTDTTNYLYPWLYSADGFVFKFNYSAVGSNYESSVSSVWETGWRNFGVPGARKWIKRVKVYYTGEAGTLSVNIKGDDYNIDQTFNIDMSVLPDSDVTDRYTGTPYEKIYTWQPPVNSSDENSLISELFKFKVSHSGTDDWTITKVQVLYETQEDY